MTRWLAVVGGAASAMALTGALAASLGGGTGAFPSAAATREIPPRWLGLYMEAASTCPGLPWAVLAAVGTVESANGTSRAPGVASGSNPAGAEGPMQFEPATFAAYAVTGPGGAAPPSPYDPVDAAYSAARMLCANGGGSPERLAGAVYSYNHSAAYVSEVLSIAASFGGSSLPLTPATQAAIAFASAALGTPYVWGGTGRGGFDCSGLVQAAYAAGGVRLPRVAQDQYDAGPAVPAWEALQPGDLVFFGTSGADVSHVGLYLGGGEMIDAPHTGADVREERVPSQGYVGATRPA